MKTLLIVDSGKRAFREYILQSLAKQYKMVLIDSVLTDWTTGYVQHQEIVDFKNQQSLLDLVAKLNVTQGFSGVLTYDETKIVETALIAQHLEPPRSHPRNCDCLSMQSNHARCFS